MVGTGLVTNSIENLLSLNRELGVSVLYESTSSPYQLQFKTMWSRRSLSGVLEFYNNSQTSGYYALKPIYGSFESSLQIGYRIKNEPERQIYFYSGVGLNFIRLSSVKERFWFKGPTFLKPVENVMDLLNPESTRSLSIILGLNSKKELSKNGRPYILSIQYQQNISKAPLFEYIGQIQINEQVYPQRVTLDPRLGALSVRISIFLINARLKL